MTENKQPRREFFFAKAKSFESTGNWLEAVHQYQSLLELEPYLVEGHHNLSLALRQCGKYEDALFSAQIAASLEPNNHLVQFLLGVSLEKCGNYTDSIFAYSESLKINPEHIPTLSNMGRLLETAGKIKESVEVLEKANKLAPESEDIAINLGIAYLSNGKPERTKAMLNKMLVPSNNKKPNLLSTIHNSLGVSAYITGDTTTAISHLEKAIEYCPNLAEAHENLAQVLLSADMYEQAWLEYEWRWKNSNNKQTKRKLPGIQWNGEKLIGMKLLVHSEQGFGDVIQFVRFLSMIKIQSGKLILACHRSLVPLLSTLPTVDQVVDIRAKIPEYDRHVAIMSLPRILKITGSNIPLPPYLKANPGRPIPHKGKFNIGIVWAGMPRHQYDPYRNRSCPVEKFELLLKIRGIKVFSLQTGPNQIDLNKINKSGLISDLHHDISSFRDTAEIILGLDLIITIDTATAHLAGALGKKVWVLLAKSPDWRWQPEKAKNLWYPSARLFVQQTPGDWSEPFEQILDELTCLIP